MAYTTRLLVVASQTADSPDLIEALQERAAAGPISVTLLLPAAERGREGREAAARRAEEVLGTWREAGIEATGTAGPTDPVEAVMDVWQPGRFDEVLVSTLPEASSRWLRCDLPNRVAKLTDPQVHHVVARDSARARPPGHAPPPHESNPLGPLAVLSWGGRS